MAKDRLLELQNMASKHNQQKNKHNRSNSGEAEETETTPLTLDEFTKQINEIQSTIESIDEKIKELKASYNSLLKSMNKNEATDDQIEQCSREITNLMSKSRKQLECLKFHVASCEKNTSETEMRVKKAQLQTMTTMFLKTKQEYDNVNDKHKTELREKLKRHIEIVGKKVSQNEIDEMIDQGNVYAFNDDVILETKRLKQTLKDVEERHEEFIEIEKKIQEIRDLMLEIYTTVYDQDKTVDIIAKKTEEGAVDAENGRKNINEALIKKKKAKKCRCYLILFVVIIAIIILITVTLSILKSLK